MIPAMSQNDLIAFEAAFENWRNERAQGLNVDPYLYFCLEQFLKPFDLSDSELESGITDGPGDGGVDAIYFLVNGDLIQEDSEPDVKSSKVANLLLYQIKPEEGFKPTEMQKLVFFTENLLDLSKPASHFSSEYNPEVLDFMHTFKEQYKRIAGAFPKTSIDYYYITRGDEVEPNQSAHDIAQKIREKVKANFSKAEFSFTFVNVQRLLEQIQRRPPRRRPLEFAENPLPTNDGLIGLVRLRDYYKFIQEDNGELSRRIFESNVRGYQQNTQVNQEIRASLYNRDSVNFWLLNNGITILTSRTESAGLRRLEIEDAQVVNGVQTSREIYDYFQEGDRTGDDRTALVRIIETQDSTIRDKIIKATNNQNKMPAASLRATDEIHGQIEELFKQSGFYYDRRKGRHRDEGRPINRIIGIVETLQAVVSILLQRPDDARARPSNYIKKDDLYASVFGKDEYPLGVYLPCVRLVKKVEQFLRAIPLEKKEIRNLKFYIASFLACRLTQSPQPPASLVFGFDPEAINDKVLKRCYSEVLIKYKKLGADDTAAKGPALTKLLTRTVRRRYKKSNEDEAVAQ